MDNVAVWDIFEAAFDGPSDGNPYLDITFEASFRQHARTVRVPGFYDGEGTYKSASCPTPKARGRLPPGRPYRSSMARPAGSKRGRPRQDAHGPVRVRNRFHFAYADGTPYLPFGTTCYAWTHQPPEMQAETLATLGAGPASTRCAWACSRRTTRYNVNPPLHDVFQPGAGRQARFRPAQSRGLPAFRNAGRRR